MRLRRSKDKPPAALHKRDRARSACPPPLPGPSSKCGRPEDRPSCSCESDRDVESGRRPCRCREEARRRACREPPIPLPKRRDQPPGSRRVGTEPLAVAKRLGPAAAGSSQPQVGGLQSSWIWAFHVTVHCCSPERVGPAAGVASAAFSTVLRGARRG